MTIVAVDDTDSRERGMCTTYVGARLAERLDTVGGRVLRRLLVRLNPAVKHKTRGNAAVAIHVDGVGVAEAFDIAEQTVREFAAASDPRTSPGVVVADINVADINVADIDIPDIDDDGDPFALEDVVESGRTSIPDDVADFARRALRHRLPLDEALALADERGFRHAAFGSGGATGSDAVEGRGRIGALAAIGAPAAFDDWTAERIAYRELDRCGTPREVDVESIFSAADEAYPVVWDTVDRETGAAVCVPNAPGPILHGIRGDDAEACRRVGEAIESEPVERTATFLTNQGTDAHLAPGTINDLRDSAGYRVDAVVTAEPETKRGGRVHVDVARDEHVEMGIEAADRTDDADGATAADGAATAVERLRCVAFAPTGRFRDRVRALRPGDRVTLCGEHERRDLGEGSERIATLKLEKFAVRDLVRTEPAVPACPECGRSMSSAGRDQGYRCRECGTDASGKVDREIDREIELGWYEVPPSARRHVAKPLIRGGFDAPTHPER
ncbi:TiaS agmantine-binding domain-containing protein [Halorubrum trueperi]|uniref:tRNA(Ile2) 2-agmatinylcytidine synthetase TiaS n=1 Tax=Halorubrum trueperi TaxID=2004704 RepID=A0ABD5UDD0_9EURY